MSGFLSDYSKFEKVQDDAPVWESTDRADGRIASDYVKLWRDASGLRELSQYDRIIVEQTELRLSENSQVPPAKAKELAQYLQDTLIAALQERYPLAENAGSGVLRFRAAITDIYPSRVFKDPNPTVELTNSTAGGGTFEGEAIDSVTGERVFGIIAEVSGSRWDLLSQTDRWKQTKSCIAEMARFVRHLMDRAQSGALEPS